LRIRLAAGLGALVLAGLGIVGITVNLKGGQSVRHVKRQVSQTIPTVPIAVLNATQDQGAAGRLALQLQRSRVKVAKVGNLNESLPPGLVILYSPQDASDARGQAEVLARMLAARKPTIEPMNPVAQAAAGNDTQLAVVIA
jgi:hypothetical protein